MTDRQDRKRNRQDRQTDRQTDRQVAFIGKDYSKKYLKRHLMVGEAEGCSQVTYSLYTEISVDFQTLYCIVLVSIPVQKKFQSQHKPITLTYALVSATRASPSFWRHCKSNEKFHVYTCNSRALPDIAQLVHCNVLAQ